MRAPLRIRKPAAEAALEDARDAPAEPPREFAGWLERVVKLVPSEIVAVYLAGRGYAAAIPGIWPLICLAMLLVVRIWGTNERGRGPQWIAIGISAVSFVIFVFAMGGRVLGYGLDTNTASLLVLVWATVVPALYRGD